MYQWFFPNFDSYKYPLSGNVTQAISPDTNWLSPQVEFNFAGDQQVEKKVVAEVASYGKQLGMLSKAVLELANGEKGEAIARLEKLVEQIDEAKYEQRYKLEHRVKTDLKQLKRTDPKLLKDILKECDLI